MTITKSLLLAAVVSLAALAAHAPAQAQSTQARDPLNTLIIELKSGKVVVQLRPDLAPKHVERVKTLAGKGFYDGIVFHRVIEGFMAQTGDPTGTGRGGSDLPDLPAEFTREVYKRGTIGAARTANPNSANSQFFICFDNSGCRGLTGQYTVWGQVVEGMEHVDQIAKGQPPASPDKMLKVYIAAEKG